MNSILSSSRLRPSLLKPLTATLGMTLCLSPMAQAAPDSTSSSSTTVAPRATAPVAQERAVAPLPVAPLPTQELPRFAQNQTTPVPRNQGDANSPAAAPRERPRGLEVPVGPATTPPDAAPGAPPAGAPNPAQTPPIAPPTPQFTPDVPPIIGNVAEAEGREIADVIVVGNRVIPTETILAKIRTQRGAAFSARQAELDRARIAAELGYFATVQIQIAPSVTEVNKNVITFIVVENGVVNGFRFVNATALKEADILPVLSSKVGVVLNNNNVNQDVAAIQKLYRERGFAVLVQNVNREGNGTLVYTLQEARVSRIELSGLKKTRSMLIQRQVRVRSGDAFDDSKLRRDLNRIYDLGFFEDATFKVDEDPVLPGSVIVTYLLKEKRTGQLSFGVGFDSRSKLSGFASVQENNLGGSGKRALGSIETGSRRNFELSYGNPFIGDKNASYDVSLYSRSIFRVPRLVANLLGTGQNDTSTINFQEQRTGGRFNFTKPLDYNRNRTLLFGYRNERARLFQTDNNGVQVPVLNLRSSGTISAFSAGLLRDQRDLRLDPSRGSRQQVILELGTKLLGDTSFTKLDIDLRRYLPLLGGRKATDQPRLVLAGRFVLGKSLNELPAFEQYYVGGSETVRGYQADAQFGDNQFYSNFELRYRFQNKVQLVGFVDAGRAFGGTFASNSNANNGTNATVGTLFSVGVGVRLNTPIGPVRLDLGRGTQGVQTHFAIGPTF